MPVLEYLLGLVAESTASEQAAQVFLVGRPACSFTGNPFRFFRRKWNLQQSCIFLSNFDCEQDSLVNRADTLEVWMRSAWLDPCAQETANSWFCTTLQTFDQPIQSFCSWRFRNHRNDFCVWIRFEGVQGSRGGNPPNLVRKVVAASADSVGNAQTGVMDLAGEFLQSRPRRSDHSNRSFADNIGETDAYTADKTGTTIRSHDQELLPGCELFQFEFFFDGNVAAEQEYIQIRLERLTGFAGGIFAGDRDYG